MTGFIQAFLIPLGVTLLGSFIFWIISRWKKDYKITCEQLSFRQYKEKESNDVKITLSYKNERVGDSLSVMTVRLANNGKKDISFNQLFEGKISIVLNNARIIDVQIEKQSDRVGATVEQSDEGDWLLSWAILKRKEIIVLKVVSVQNVEDSEEEVNGSDLEFVFRGNNINEISPISPLENRKLVRFVFAICVIFLALCALIPTQGTVKYDGVVQGLSFNSAKISYNAYTRLFSIEQANQPTIVTDSIQGISTSTQPLIQSDAKITITVILVYLVGLIIMTVLALRRPRFFRKVFSVLRFSRPKKGEK